MDHLQALKTHCDARTRRQTGPERGQERCVVRTDPATAAETIFVIPMDATRLLFGVRQLHVSVSQFDRAEENFKSIRNARIIRAQACKRRLAGRIMSQDG